MPRKGVTRPEAAFREHGSNRRSKAKAQIEGTQAETQEHVATDGGENAMDVTQVEAQEVAEAVESQESVPATIVESTETEVFPEQTEDQEVVNTTAEEVVVETEGDTTQNQPVEQPAAKPPKLRVNRRPYVQLVAQMLEKKDGCERQEIIDAVRAEFPTVSKGSITTFITDAKNPKYSYFKDRPVITHPETGKLIFADRVEKVSAAEAPAETSSEQEVPVEEVSAQDEIPTEEPGE
jgi:hypothetical protein